MSALGGEVRKMSSQKIRIKSIQLDVNQNHSYDEAVREAKNLAVMIGCEVNFSFNKNIVNVNSNGVIL